MIIEFNAKLSHTVIILPRQVFEREFSSRIPMYMQVIKMQGVVR